MTIKRFFLWGSILLLTLLVYALLVITIPQSVYMHSFYFRFLPPHLLKHLLQGLGFSFFVALCCILLNKTRLALPTARYLLYSMLLFLCSKHLNYELHTIIHLVFTWSNTKEIAVTAIKTVLQLGTILLVSTCFHYQSCTLLQQLQAGVLTFYRNAKSFLVLASSMTIIKLSILFSTPLLHYTPMLDTTIALLLIMLISYQRPTLPPLTPWGSVVKAIARLASFFLSKQANIQSKLLTLFEWGLLLFLASFIYGQQQTLTLTHFSVPTIILATGASTILLWIVKVSLLNKAFSLGHVLQAIITTCYLVSSVLFYGIPFYAWQLMLLLYTTSMVTLVLGMASSTLFLCATLFATTTEKLHYLLGRMFIALPLVLLTVLFIYSYLLVGQLLIAHNAPFMLPYYKIGVLQATFFFTVIVAYGKLLD